MVGIITLPEGTDVQIEISTENVYQIWCFGGIETFNTNTIKGNVDINLPKITKDQDSYRDYNLKEEKVEGKENKEFSIEEQGKLEKELEGVLKKMKEKIIKTRN